MTWAFDSTRLARAAIHGLEARGSEMYSRKVALVAPGAKGIAACTLALVTLLGAGCATAPPPKEDPKLVWPAPPLTCTKVMALIVSDALPVIAGFVPETVAVTVAVPSATVVTSTLVSTVAAPAGVAAVTAQVTARPARMLFAASRTVAVACAVAPFS